MQKIKYFLFPILFCIVFFSISFSSQAAHRVQQTDEEIVIVIDPGHGGENLGTIENGVQEKSMTLITAQAMYDELCKYEDVKVYMTRTGDVDLTLESRAQFAASVDADFLFSIHYNASVKHNLFGSEVWISATAPYNAYGYQFGYQYLNIMQDMGLYLRGIKTKLNDNNTDYYGIIRESTALSIPSVIIEHCHVDEERDYLFCDTEEELVALGRTDATAVAKYFGLKSNILGVDYSENMNLPTAEENRLVKSTLTDETVPDVCMIELADTDDSTGLVTIDVTAADYDTPLLYYDYSYDGGVTYSPLQEWPGCDVLQGTYQDTFSFTLQVPSGVQPQLVFRAYNLFDRCTESNKINVMHQFLYGEDTEKDHIETKNVTEETIQGSEETENLPGTTTFMPAVSEKTEGEDKISFLSFLQLCLFLVIGLFFILFISRILFFFKRRKRISQRRKEAGNNKDHIK